VIPAKLRSYASIEKDVVSLGLRSRVEIWARERYPQSFGSAPDTEQAVPLNLY
jgi:DNA-binding transcriptional regulator/RsmH inhibitor MraZ